MDENRVKEVVIRRLKREIREADQQAGRPERFGDRDVQPVPLFFGAEERALSRAFSAFRKSLLSAIASQTRGEQMAGRFAIEILNKRLLSCPFTFADSWLRFKEGTRDEEPAETTEVRAAQTVANQDSADDREREERSRHAAKTVGAWLKPWLSVPSEEIAAIDESLANLGLNAANSWPRSDERYERLKKLIRERIRDGNAWRNDERLIVSTEYKTSLDYLKARLEQDFRDNGNAIRILFGDPSARENRQRIIRHSTIPLTRYVFSSRPMSQAKASTFRKPLACFSTSTFPGIRLAWSSVTDAWIATARRGM